MSSEAREISDDEGQPIALFTFMRGALRWRYTSADRAITLGANTFAKAAISRGKIEQGAERRRVALPITLAADLPVAANWRPFPPGDVISVLVQTMHAGESDALVDWIGRVVAPKFNGVWLELTCEPSATRARRPGGDRCWQRGCGLALYGQGAGLCNVDPDEHAVSGTVSAVDVTATAFGTFADGRLAGGSIEWTRADGLVERRSINEHLGTRVTIDRGAADLAAALALDVILPGCRHDEEDCEGYFGNGINYGGDKNMPRKSPFDGDPVQ